MIKFKNLAAIVTISAMCIPYGVFAENNVNIEPIYCMAYYDSENTLISVKELSGTLTEDESNVLAHIYKPENAAEATLYKWDSNLTPVENALSVDISHDYDINIINTNDMHGSMVSSSSTIGADKIAALKQMLNNSLLFDAGDATQGIAFASLSKGSDVINVMNCAGYDAMVLGNHEFDYGLEQLKSNIQSADFDVLSANTYMKTGELLTDSSALYQISDTVTVGVFGLTTVDTKTSTGTANTAEIEFKDEIETAKEQVNVLDAAGADVIIALTHMGTTDAVQCSSLDLASAMKDTGLDVIIDGHSHTVVNTVQDGINIIQTGTGSVNAGKIGIDVNDDGTVTVDASLLSTEFFKNIEPDKTVTDEINRISEEQSVITQQVVAKSDTTLWGGYVNNVSEARVHETNLGDMICDSMLDYAKEFVAEEYKDLPVVSANNGGGIRDTIYKGDVTMGDIINVLPFANTVMYKEITPEILYSILESSVSGAQAQDLQTGMITSDYNGSFLQIGGMSFEYDPNEVEGSKVQAVYLDGSQTPLDRNDETTKIIFVSNDYIMSGGDNFTVLSTIPLLGEGSGLADILIDYMTTTDNKYPVTQGRIRTSYTAAEYTAHVRVQDIQGNTVSDKSVSFEVDGVQVNAQTDGEGIASFTVSDGPHTVSSLGEDVYINNYSGAGLVETDGDYPVKYPAVICDVL